MDYDTDHLSVSESSSTTPRSQTPRYDSSSASSTDPGTKTPHMKSEEEYKKEEHTEESATRNNIPEKIEGKDATSRAAITAVGFLQKTIILRKIMR